MSPPIVVAGCIHETKPMMAVSTMSHPSTMAPAAEATVRAMGSLAKTAIAAARKLPPTTTKRTKPGMK